MGMASLQRARDIEDADQFAFVVVNRRGRAAPFMGSHRIVLRAADQDRLSGMERCANRVCSHLFFGPANALHEIDIFGILQNGLLPFHGEYITLSVYQDGDHPGVFNKFGHFLHMRQGNFEQLPMLPLLAVKRLALQNFPSRPQIGIDIPVFAAKPRFRDSLVDACRVDNTFLYKTFPHFRRKRFVIQGAALLCFSWIREYL